MSNKPSRIIAMILVLGTLISAAGCSKKHSSNSTHRGGGTAVGNTISIKPNDNIPKRKSSDTDETDTDSDVSSATTSSETTTSKTTSSKTTSSKTTTSSTSSSTPKKREPSVDPNLKVGVNYTVTGTKNYLAVRSEPYYDGSNEIAKMHNGDELTVESQNVYGDKGEYCYITAISGDAAGKSGYVNKNYITPSSKKTTSSTPERPKEESSAPAESEPSSKKEKHGDINESNVFVSIPSEFYFMSGVGNWYTVIKIYGDGSFEGQYIDVNMGETGTDYPNGTTYTCEFTGKFADVVKVDDYTYSMHVVSLEQKGTKGDESIEDGVKYVVAYPYGFDDADEFELYLPGRPTYDLTEDFMSWTRIGMQGEPEIPEGVYGLYNVNGKQGFRGED